VAGTPVLRSLGVVEGCFQRRYGIILNRAGSLIVANEFDGPSIRAYGKKGTSSMKSPEGPGFHRFNPPPIPDFFVPLQRLPDASELIKAKEQKQKS
jgi:hypothetical protein